jgi:anti-anti-sigma factor
MSQYRHLQVNTRNGVVVVQFVDKWLANDLARGSLGEELVALAAQDGCSKVLLNLVGVTYLSSAMLGHLVSLSKQLAAKGGKLALCGLAPTVQEIVTMMKLDTILSIRDNEGDGLNVFA